MSRTTANRYASGKERASGRSYDAARYQPEAPVLPSSEQPVVNHTILARPAQLNSNKGLPVPERSGSSAENESSVLDNPNSVIPETHSMPLQIEEPAKNPSSSLHGKPPPKKSAVLKRSAVAKPSDPVQEEPLIQEKAAKKPKVKQPLVRWRLLLSWFATFFIVGVLGGLAAFITNGPYQEQQNHNDVLAEQTSRTSSVQTQQPLQVAETAVSAKDIEQYKTDDEHPRLIQIDTIDLAARTKASGVNRQNQLTLPDNIFDVNWYEGSRAPGQNGVVLMSGYVSGPNERAAFYYLRALELGDVITVETGDGTKYRYEVRHREYIARDKVDVFSLLVPYEPGVNSLHLMAVDDRYNVMSNDFQDRLVVYAVEL